MTVARDISWPQFVRNWIDKNLDRGHSVEALIESMTKDGFGEQESTEAVHAILRGEVSSTYEYDPSPVPHDRVVHAHDREIHTLLRVEKPQLILFDSVLSADECDRVIEMSANRLNPSTTIDPATGDFEQGKSRASESCLFGLSENPLIDRIDRRISALMNWPLENGEGLQVVHYPPGGEYRHHFDFYAPQGSISHLIGGGQRTATMIVYLNDVEAGGGTEFPRAGITFTPRKGQALYFRYFNNSRQLDPATEHAGLPVQSGEKWIINKWMRRYRAAIG